MELIAKLLIGLIALLHFYFLWFEMFAWESRGYKVFRKFSKSFFKESKSLAANQGLYNGFLSAGLVWALIIQDEQWSRNVSLFFLSCVSIAGIYGAFSADKKILYIQAIPALLTMVILIYGF